MPTAVITGASSQIGKAIVASLKARGYNLILPTHGEFDLGLADGQDQFCEEIKKRVSAVDVLVHNAAIFEKSTLKTLSREAWRASFSLNVEAPLFITKGLLPLLEAAKAPCVINLIDCMYNKAWRNYLAYNSSKAMLAHLTKALAQELGGHIRVNAVAPGIVNFTPDSNDEMKSRVLAKIPMNRIARPDEIASAVTYLACDASYATGEIMMVDGGRHLI